MDGSQAGRTCSQCGAQLEDDASNLCLACAVGAADAQVESAPSTPDAVERRLRGAPTSVLYGICLVCLAIIAWRGPAFVQSVQPQHPIRTGVYTTAGQCDACVENLWVFSAALMDGSELPAQRLTCPATGEPYVVTESADGTVVSCPNPEEHSLSSLSVGGGVQIPEARR